VVQACLVDVYETLLDPRWPERVGELAAFIGVDTDAWLAEWSKTHADRDRGKISVANAFTGALRGCGIEPTPALVDAVLRKDAELMRSHERLYPDSVPFLHELRDRGLRIALVSNCADTTRPLLTDLGVLPLVDAVILSCEVGSMKPSPDIYVTALEDLGVAAADAVFIDDQHHFCVGAEAVGIRPVQILRNGASGQPAPVNQAEYWKIPGQPGAAVDGEVFTQRGFPVVHSLFDVRQFL
jgi:HAD superfamily hydrolase (TIGR01509 family)